jgi:uncharacterized phiE125 gp8 family phage protein
MPPTPYHMLRRISSAAAELISLAEAKLYLRVDNAADDVLISELIVAVRSYAEMAIGRSLVEQSWQVDYREGLSCDVTLPMQPVRSITSIVAKGDTGSSLTLPSTSYRLLSPSLLHIDSAISASVISVNYVAGDNVTTPRDLRQAMLSHLAMCYDRRGSDVPIPADARTMYDSTREIRL